MNKSDTLSHYETQDPEAIALLRDCRTAVLNEPDESRWPFNDELARRIDSFLSRLPERDKG